MGKQPLAGSDQGSWLLWLCYLAFDDRRYGYGGSIVFNLRSSGGDDGDSR